MPATRNDGVELYYETAGEGPPVVFLSDLGCGPWLWGWQAPALAGPFEAIVPSLRGTGRSGDPGTHSIEAMAADVEAVLAACEARKAALVGAGMGGMVALEYARAHSRADRLVLLGTPTRGDRFDASAFLGSPDDLDRLLSREFRDAHPGEVDRIAAWRREEDAAEATKRAQADAAGAFDASGWCHEVTEPALVLHGDADEVVSVDAGEALARDLPRGRFEAFEAGSHLLFVEQSRLVTDAIEGFLDDASA